MAKKNEANKLDGMEDILDAVENEVDSTKNEEAPMAEDASVSEEVVTEDTSVDMSGEIDALFEGVDFPEDFKKKTQVIFESTVNAKVNQIVAEKLPSLVEQHSAEMKATMAEHIETLYNRVDTFMDAIVEQWYTENEVAVKSTLRADLAESFMTGMKELFESNYVTIPEESVDLFEAEKDKNNKLTEMLDTTMKSLEQKNMIIEQLNKRDIINENIYGLTELDAEKFRSLAESVEFVSEDEFSSKLATIKETFFKTPISEGSNKDDLPLDIVVEEKAPINNEIEYLADRIARMSSRS